MSEAMREAFEALDWLYKSSNLPDRAAKYNKIKAALSGAQQGEAIRAYLNERLVPGKNHTYVLKKTEVDTIVAMAYAAPQPAQVAEGWLDALQLAMDICDRVPTRLHKTAQSEWARDIGTMVNAQDDGSHGYAVIRNALESMLTAAPSGDAKPVQDDSEPPDDGYNEAVSVIAAPANSILMTLSREDVQLDGDEAGAAIIANFFEKLDRLLKKSGARFNEDCDALVFDHSGDAKRESEDAAGMERIVEAVAHIGVDFGYGPYELEDHHIDRAREIMEAARLRQSSDGDDSEGVE